jgi:DNA (cytosine-5)-methyltransferase 1
LTPVAGFTTRPPDLQHVSVLWLSPDCKHHSKAKGGKPVDRRIRGLAWEAVRWANIARPDLIILENVQEFEEWCPLDKDRRPDKKRKGQTFRRFVAALRALGYIVEWRRLRACDYGTPTTRERLFLIARCDGRPIVWPKPTHSKGGRGGLLPWRTAAECIDFSIPCPSIFLTAEEGKELGVRRPLAPKTDARIGRGMWRFVLGPKALPFIIPVTHGGDLRGHSIDEPVRTITGAHRGEHAFVAPYLVPRYGERVGQDPRALPIDQPAPVIVPTQNGGSLVAAFLAKHNGGHEATGTQLRLPTDTITARDHHALVTSHLMKLKGTCRDGQAVDRPIDTVQASGNHYAEVRAFLIKYHSSGGQHASLFDPAPTVVANDSIGLVMVGGEAYVVSDIGMRMLRPRELFRCQGFPDSYQIDIVCDRTVRGKKVRQSLPAEAQVRMVGNSVCPQLAMVLAAANKPERDGLIVDLFAGGGGTSLGLEWALGRSPDIAANHDPEAVAMHMANHPDTVHYIEDVRKLDIRRVIAAGGSVAA